MAFLQHLRVFLFLIIDKSWENAKSGIGNDFNKSGVGFKAFFDWITLNPPIG